jgi:modification methylase
MPPRKRTIPKPRAAPQPGCSGTPTITSTPATKRASRRASCDRPPAARSRDLPIAIWPCAQKTSQTQRRGRYLPESNQHPGKMLPALARQAIETYSDPGDVVLDPMCGIGTTLVEAIHAGRHGLGIELDRRWANLARANIAHASTQGAPDSAQVIEGDARHLPEIVPTPTRLLRSPAAKQSGPDGTVDLVLTSPPYACGVAGSLVQRDGRIRDEATFNYSADRANLGHARGDAYLRAMAEVYAACASVLKPGGFLVLVTKDMRSEGALRNLSGQTITLCEDIGLRYWQRVIGLLAAVRDSELVMRPSFWQLIQTRRARALGGRTHVVAHEDILVFRKSEPLASSRTPSASPPHSLPARARPNRPQRLD